MICEAESKRGIDIKVSLRLSEDVQGSADGEESIIEVETKEGRRVRQGDKTYSGTPMARSGMGICTKAIRPVSNSPY